MTHSEKTMMSRVNVLLCGLHLIHSLTHQAKTTLLLWENIVLGDQEIGVHSTPNIGTTELEAGTVRLVRTVSDAVQEFGWAEDEFDEVPLSPSSGNRIDNLFHNGAGVYCISRDLVEFTSKCGAGNSSLAAVTADLEVHHFKARCRALGLIF
ncbi:unnamed protein product [Coregonus sp. 'balchen']|nr:unnamed protein product [Coregonus sp. 'balchen']